MSKSKVESSARLPANRWLKPFVLVAVFAIAVAGVWITYSLKVGAERRAILKRLPPRPNLNTYNDALREAVDQAERHLVDGNLGAGVGALGNLYLANNFLHEADACYTLAMELEPNNAFWPHALAYVRTTMGDSAGAMSLLDLTIRLDPEYLPARLRRADARYKGEDGKGAESDYRKCLDLKPGNVYALWGLARIAIDHDDWGDAESLVRTALTTEPQFSPAHRLLAAVHDHYGRTEERDKELDVAGHLGRYVPFPDPWLDSLEALCMRTDILIRKGYAAKMAVKLEEARDIYERILKYDPTCCEATVHLADVTASLGDVETAAALYRRALTLSPRDASQRAEIYTYLASIYSLQGNLVQARENLESALAIKHDYEEAHLVLASVLTQLGEPEKSIEHCVTVLKLYPKSPIAELDWGLALVRMGKFGEAIVHFGNATQLNPDLAAAYYHLGKCYIECGDFGTGMRYIRQALQKAQETGDRRLAGQIRAEFG